MLDQKTLYKLIGDRIKTSRERNKFTQEDLGKRAGYQNNSQQVAISALERGIEGCSIYHLYRICQALGVTPNELMGYRTVGPDR